MALWILFASTNCCAQIDTQQYVTIGGIQQWIQIKGENEQNPILLFLHGGPGNSAAGYAHKFTHELKKHFVVVLWDQRDTGKTLQMNASDQPLSLSLAESDVVEMIDYLLTRFKKDKLYLMGHSWGGFLALRTAGKIPQKLEACLAVSPMIAQLESEQLSLAWLTEQANKVKNLKAQRELAEVKVPFQNAEQIFTHRYWLAHFTANKPVSKAFVAQWAERWLAVFNQASAVDLRQTPTFDCPVYLFIGDRDYQTHYSLAQPYFDLMKAEKKQLFWFKNSGHNLNLTQPKRLQQLIIDLRK